MAKRALVFDLDDTLYPERQFVRSGLAAVGAWLREQRGVEGFADEAGRVFDEGVRGRIFDETLRRLGVAGAPDLVTQMVAVYRAHQPELALYDDAEWAISKFGAEMTLGIITDGFAATQRNKVAALGLAGRFRAIVYSDDLGRQNWKPSPEPFLAMMTRVECEPSACVYVGDNPGKDFAAPNQLGWITVQLCRAEGEYAHLRSSRLPAGFRAQREIDSLRELEAILS